MMKRTKAMFAVLATFLIWASFAPQGLAQNRPSVLENTCPFEGCQYGNWTTKSELPVYQNEGDSQAAFTLKTNEGFTAIKGNIHVKSPGIVKVIRGGNVDTFPMTSSMNAKVSVQKGDLIYLLSPIGEGYYRAWFQGKQIEISDECWQQINQFNVSLVSASNSLRGKLIKSPQTAWWVFIKTQDGKVGWLQLLGTEELNGADALE
jgi:hypothetical protein